MALVLFVFLPLDNQRAFGSRVSRFSVSPAFAGQLNVLLFAWLPLLVLMALCMLLLYRQVRRRDAGRLDEAGERLLNAEMSWLFAFAGALAATMLVCRVAGAVVGLADKADAFPRQLSGGQQQRIAIARALALQPKVLLFDEPTSALDPELVSEVLSVIEELARSGTTLVIVTHELAFARRVADHVVMMDQGRVIEQGTPEALFERPRQQRTADFLAKTL
ncbi:ATP-binding cassette domain-containing protein [Stenotrophomonas sp.]|uniref:amino acid ABC transporter ATP-binding protein n=1 Tax=Stenotrophomonas sp. TaxID=69392 RepID=UPI0031F32699